MENEYYRRNEKYNLKKTMTANYIYNETLTGVVDGVNTVFTTIQNIDKIEDVYLGGSPYRDLTYTGGTNVVTLADAPPLLSVPTIDYFFSTVTPVWPSDAVTFGDIIDDTYEKLGLARTSPVILESQVQRQINKGYKRIKNIKSYKDKVLQYTFNKANDSAAIGYSASSVTTTDTDYVPASGAVLLWDTSFVNYSTYSSGVFWATAWYVYASGDRVSIGYKLPSGVKRPSEVIMDKTILTYADNREFVVYAGNNTYTIFQDAAWDEYIFLPYKATDAIITVKYVPEYDILDDDTDVINILYEYADLLSLYAAYNTLLLREDERWMPIKQEYIELLKDYQAYKSSAVDGIKNKFRTTPLVWRRGYTSRSRFI